jgi:hypothetical protein
MLFKKEFLQEIEDNDDVEIVEDEITDTTRWSILNRRVFKFEGKFYETFYQHGATECQDESPYEYDEDQIECKEVFPVEKTVIVYE